MKRSVMLAAVIAVSVQLIGISTSSAKASSPGSVITCTGYSGQVTSLGTQASLTGCSGHTGGSGVVLGKATTIYWANSTRTSFSFRRSRAKTMAPTKKCPSSTQWVFRTQKAVVSSDTTGSTRVGAKVTIPMTCEWWVITDRVSAFQLARGFSVTL
jgi:hypothetical protein